MQVFLCFFGVFAALTQTLACQRIFHCKLATTRRAYPGAPEVDCRWPMPAGGIGHAPGDCTGRDFAVKKAHKTKSPEFTLRVQDVLTLLAQGSNTIIVFCSHGKHRSVSVASAAAETACFFGAEEIICDHIGLECRHQFAHLARELYRRRQLSLKNWSSWLLAPAPGGNVPDSSPLAGSGLRCDIDFLMTLDDYAELLRSIPGVLEVRGKVTAAGESRKSAGNHWSAYELEVRPQGCTRWLTTAVTRFRHTDQETVHAYIRSPPSGMETAARQIMQAVAAAAKARASRTRAPGRGEAKAKAAAPPPLPKRAPPKRAPPTREKTPPPKRPTRAPPLPASTPLQLSPPLALPPPPPPPAEPVPDGIIPPPPLPLPVPLDRPGRGV